jgi:hypothetical protein
MSLTVGTPVKILALVGVLGALALGAGFALLGKTSGSDSTPAVVEPLHAHHTVADGGSSSSKPAATSRRHATHPRAAAKRPAATHGHAVTTPKPVSVAHGHAAAQRPAAAPHRHTAATPRAPVAPMPKPVAIAPKSKPASVAPALPADGLPAVINRALRSHAVVVVSLYDPQAEVDAASLGEASAGARLAGAGFVPLNVLSQAEAEPLAKKLGVLPDPALLVFQAPDTLVFRIDGFADRDTVAQAVANAMPMVGSDVAWRTSANQICAAAGSDPAQLNQLRALDVPATSSPAFASFLNDYAKLLTGPRAGRAAAAASVSSSGSTLGLTDCTGKPKS